MSDASSVTYNVSTFAELRTALKQVQAGTAGSTSGTPTNNVTINITADLKFDRAVSDSDAEFRGGLPMLSNPAMNLIINGNGHTIDGQQQIRGFMVTTGTVAINDINIKNMLAHGGEGGTGLSSGGGGAGLGGALFVGAGGDVTIKNVHFQENAAIGGDGGQINTAGIAGGGGGGLGGEGGNSGGDYQYDEHGNLYAQTVGGGGGGGGINDWFRTNASSNGLAYLQAGGGSGGGQFQDYVKQFSIVGWTITTESGVQTIDGPVAGFKWGSSGAHGGSPLSGGGGGGIGGHDSLAYYNPVTSVQESFPHASLVAAVIVGLAGTVFPEFALVAAAAKLGTDLGNAIERDTWTPAEIAGLTIDVVSFAIAAKGAYDRAAQYAEGEVVSLFVTSPSKLVQSVFKTVALDHASAVAKNLLIGAVHSNDPHAAVNQLLTNTFNAIKLGLVNGSLPQIFPNGTNYWQGKALPAGKGAPTAGGDGGWGGGGGGGSTGGGDGGFGGGGGGGGPPFNAYFQGGGRGTAAFVGGNGGFGGGGGGGGLDARGGYGGFGAGDGTDGIYLDPETKQVQVWSGQGGGGLGAGGAVFVEDGGKLTVSGNSFFKDNFAAGGLAINSGRGLGHDFFLQGTETLTLNPDGRISIQGGIADQSGSGLAGYENLRANVQVVGNGLLDFSGLNTFAGKLIIGTAEVGAINNALVASGTLTSLDQITHNGNVRFWAEGKWNPQMTVQVMDGARISVDNGAHFTAAASGQPDALRIDMSQIGANDLLDLQWNRIAPNIELINWGEGPVNLYEHRYTGDGIGLIFVGSALRMVQFTSNGVVGSQGAAIGPGDTGTVMTLIPLDNAHYSLGSANDITALNTFLSHLDEANGHVLADYSVTIGGSKSFTGTLDLKTGSAGVSHADATITDAAFTGAIDLDAANGGSEQLTIATSAFHSDGDAQALAATILDFGGSGYEVIKLAGIGWDGIAGAITRDGDVFSLATNGATYKLTLGGTVPDQLFAASDGAGNTLLFASQAQYLQFVNPSSVLDNPNAGLSGSFTGAYFINGDVGHVRTDITAGGVADITLNLPTDGFNTLAIHAAGVTGAIHLDGQGKAQVVLDTRAFDQADAHSYTFAASIENFSGSGSRSIDFKGLAFSADPAQMHWSLSGNQMTVTNGTDSFTVTLGSNAPTSGYVLGNDGSGGTILFASLSGALAWQASPEANFDRVIILPHETLNQPALTIPAISAGSLTILGNGATLDGDGVQRGFVITDGTVLIKDLTLVNMVAHGGNGAGGSQFGFFGGGGGGAGLGGAVYVGAAGHVTLDGVEMHDNSALGGNGGAGSMEFTGFQPGGGGGGMLGDANGSAGGAGFSSGLGQGGAGADDDSHPFGASGTFGGGGGAGIPSGSGGWGGGGGGSQIGSPYDFDISGNWPGEPRPGGFGAGAGNAGGGGGLGAGGNIFVQEGGQLAFADGTVSAGTVAGGIGGSGTVYNMAADGGNGSAYGSGMFLQGTQTALLAPGAGRTLSIAGVIADEAGSLTDAGQSAAGAGIAGLKIGPGRVVLSATNHFAGGITIADGTLVLSAKGAAGSGAITFQAGSGVETLVLEGSALPASGGTFGNTLNGFGSGAIVDLKGVGFTAGASASLSGNLLTVRDGGWTGTFTLGGTLPASAPLVVDDGHGGTIIAGSLPDPAGSDRHVALLEDTPVTLHLADFGYTLSFGSDLFAGIKVSSLPTAGELLLNGTSVAVGDTIAATAIDSGALTYLPGRDDSGAGYASFDFAVIGANGNFDHSVNTLTFDVAPVDDAPTIDAPSEFHVPGGQQSALYDNAEGGLTINDVDAGPYDMFEVTIEAKGELFVDTFLDVERTYDVSTNRSSLHFSGNLVEINYALLGLSYDGHATYGSNGSIHVEVIGYTQWGRATRDVPIAIDFPWVAPVAKQTSAALAAIAEDTANPAGQSVEDLVGNLIVTFGRLAGIAVTGLATPAAGGTWQYSSGAGWATIGAVSSSHALLLSASTLLRFVPAANFNTQNAARPSLAVHLIDNTAAAFDNGYIADITATNGGSFPIGADSIVLAQTITAVNDAPTASAVVLTTKIGRPLDIANTTLLAKSLDVDGDKLTITLATNPAHGQITTTSGAFQYTPYVGYIGADTFTVTLADGHGGSVLQTISIAVKGTAPATIDLKAATQGQTVDISGDKLGHTVLGSAFADVIRGSAHNDVVNGGIGNDTIAGNAGSDTLDGGTGADKMFGGAGNDTYYVDTIGDRVYETATNSSRDKTDLGGSDTVVSSVGFNLGRYFENLTLTGTTGLAGKGNELANALVGNDGANTLRGLAGNDILTGGAGSDKLYGGDGKDTLTGGAGKDYFVFDTTPATRDTITDFARVEGDKIQLSRSVFTAFGYTGVLHVDDFYAAAGATKAHDSSDRIIYDTITGILYYDADGMGGTAAVQIALMGSSTHSAVAYADLLVIA